MASRPRHEALRGLVTELLREGFGAAFSELEHERYLVDNSGRVDVTWGATVIELKTDLRREERDVLARMPDYLEDASRRSAPGRTTVGLATDGATLLAYKLDRGTLAPIGRYTVDVEHPERLLSWLESLLSPVPEVMPTTGRGRARAWPVQPTLRQRALGTSAAVVRGRRPSRSAVEARPVGRIAAPGLWR
jgi:hypothetical protein